MKKDKIKAINERHIRSIDKYYRMFKGLSSEFEDLKDGVLYLKIHISKGWNKSKVSTAIQMANCWVRNNPELRTAWRFHATLISIDGSIRFIVAIKDAQNNIHLKKLCNSFKKGLDQMDENLNGTVIEGVINNYN